MPRVAVLTALVAVAAIAAAPISLHFEGEHGTLEPFLVVFPVAALVAAAGVAIADRQRSRALAVLNLLAAAFAFFFWIGLLSFEGS